MSKILFHGGSHIIKKPEIREPIRTLDFGRGFYLTTSQSQAERWVLNRLINPGDTGYVNSYEFDLEGASKNLNIKIFENPNEEWIDFVIANRMIDGFTHKFDIVIGPVADDKVFTQLSLFEGGIISKENLIENLLTHKLVDQYLFHTELALPHLQYLSHYQIKQMKAITPDTLYLILPFKVSQLAMLMQKKLGLTLIEAMKAIYHSNTYKELAKEETKLWHLGPVALFEHYQEFQ